MDHPIHFYSIPVKDHSISTNKTHDKCKKTNESRSINSKILNHLFDLIQNIGHLFSSTSSVPFKKNTEIRQLPQEASLFKAKKLHEDHFDVMIVGAGPIGIATACALKAIHTDLKICVVDKRAEAQRTHGLRINEDSAAKITEMLDDALKNDTDKSVDQKKVQRLKNIFKLWKGNVVRTSEIETTLLDSAKQFGVSVLRGEEYKLTGASFEKIVSQNKKNRKGLNKNELKLKKYFEHAKVIVGADGAHSLLREKVIASKLNNQRGLVENETMQHFVQFKFETDVSTEQFTFLQSRLNNWMNGEYGFETMGRAKEGEGTKPGTFQLFIDEETFEALKPRIEGGVTQGDFKNPWNFNDLKNSKNPKVRKLVDVFANYKASIAKRKGRVHNEFITAIPIKAYRSEAVTKMYNGKVVALVGDASSGLVYERGFNKGIHEASMCAKAVSDFFKQENIEAEVNNNVATVKKGRKKAGKGKRSKKSKITKRNTSHNSIKNKITEVPFEFKQYEAQAQKLFSNELWWAHRKNDLLNLDRCALRAIGKIVNLFNIK